MRTMHEFFMENGNKPQVALAKKITDILNKYMNIWDITEYEHIGVITIYCFDASVDIRGDSLRVVNKSDSEPGHIFQYADPDFFEKFEKYLSDNFEERK